MCISLLVYMYMHIIYIKHFIFLHTVCFYYTDNKDGGRFLFFFLIGEEILKTRIWILLNFGGVFCFYFLFLRFSIFFHLFIF